METLFTFIIITSFTIIFIIIGVDYLLFYMFL